MEETDFVAAGRTAMADGVADEVVDGVAAFPDTELGLSVSFATSSGCLLESASAIFSFDVLIGSGGSVWEAIPRQFVAKVT